MPFLNMNECTYLFIACFSMLHSLHTPPPPGRTSFAFFDNYHQWMDGPPRVAQALFVVVKQTASQPTI